MALLIAQARQVLRQARELRDLVQQDLATHHFGSDDVRMKTYNDSIRDAAQIYSEDPVLNGQMVIMPDAVLKSYGTILPIETMPQELPSQRLEEHLTRLINRLEFRLGEPEVPERAAMAADDVLRREQNQEVRQILDTIEQLRQQQPQLQTLDQRDFAFVRDVDIRQVLKLDFVEAQLAFAAEAFKACALLTGGLIEGMLFDALQTPSVVGRAEYAQAIAQFPRIGQSINWDKVSMTQLIVAARDLQLLGDIAFRLVDGARDFRDTVHPRAEVREGMRAAH